MKIFITILTAIFLVSCATSHQVQDEVVKADSQDNISVTYSQVFGANGQIDFNRVSYNDPSLMKAGDSLHLDAIRYPGGTVSQNFNYLTDTPSLYALAMFKSYCNIGKVFFVLNMTTSTLDQQLKMLALARSLNLFTDSTLYVELNNEFVSPHDATFLDKCATWYTVLKSQYPKIHIGIPGGAPSKWNQAVLNRLPDVYLVDHYHNPNNYTKNGITDTAMIGDMMRADKIHFFSGIPTSRLWVTEFNLQIDDNTTPVFANDEQKEIAISYMYKWFAKKGFAVVLFHNIVMASGNGMIISDGKGSYLSPTGKGFILFKTTK